MIDSALPQTGPINLTLEALGVRRSVTYSTQHLLTVHLALEQSDLIAIVADTIAQLYTRSADIITRKPPVDVGELSLFLACHPRRFMYAYVNDFTTWPSRTRKDIAHAASMEFR